jgi:macrolide-specific efflux system membrane fusion protein
MRLRLLGAVLLLVIGIGAVLFVVVHPGAASGADAQYLTAQVTREDVTDDIAANGSLVPVTRYSLAFGSPAQTLAAPSSSSSSSAASNSASSSTGSGSGTGTWPVRSVKVSIGQSVKKGAILATADPSAVSQQLTQVGYQLTVAQVQLAQATSDLSAATTDQQLRQAQMSYYNAKNQISQLTAQQSTLNGELAQASITAPAAGVVDAVDIVPGADAPSGSAIILDAGGLEASVTIAEADLPRVSAGQAASVTISAVGGTVKGKVASIAPTATGGNSSVVTYAVVVSLSGVPADARAGMTASVSLTVASATNVLAVPAIALISGTDGYSVRIMGANGSVTSQAVTVGLVTSSLAEIKSGLSEGQNVVIGVSTARTSTGTTSGGGFGGLGGALGGGGGGFRGGTTGQGQGR